jgi:hypothetical protein
MPSRMYSTIQLLEIMRRSAFKSPLSYPSLLGIAFSSVTLAAVWTGSVSLNKMPDPESG